MNTFISAGSDAVPTARDDGYPGVKGQGKKVQQGESERVTNGAVPGSKVAGTGELALV